MVGRPGGLAAVISVLVLMPLVAHAHDDDKPIGKGIHSVPIFDAHIHYKQGAWEPYPPSTVLELMDTSGVAMGLVSSTPDEGTIRLWKFAPSRIVPELRPYHGNYGSSNWMTAPDMAEYLRRRLDAYPHEGIGEFHVHDVKAINRSLLTEIAKMAKARNIPIHIHSDAEPVRYLYDLEPSLTVIWAHAGMSEPAGVIGAMMEKYARLYADTSYRERDILTENGIDPEWQRVLTRFSDRFMVGSDTWVNSQWSRYRDIVEINRKWLSYFPRSIAEKIAYGNAERLFKRKVTRGLIGKR